jgi:CRISPR/Cas system-associated exonuclease Cas4 (RecB family)
LQLIIYQIALLQQQVKPVKLKYYYLHENRQGSAEFIANDKDLEKTRQGLLKTITEIKNSDFPAAPSEFNCKFCDFKNICPFSAA